MLFGSGGVGTSSVASCATSRSHPFGLGALVHAKQARDALAREQPGDRLVGGDHQVLDQAVGLRLRAAQDLGDVALLVEHELGLLRVDRQRTPRCSRARCSSAAAPRAAASGCAQGSRAGSSPAKMRSTRS